MNNLSTPGTPTDSHSTYPPDPGPGFLDQTDILSYYRAVAPFLLPFTENRLHSFFFTKKPDINQIDPQQFPPVDEADWLTVVNIRSPFSHEVLRCILANNPESISYLNHLGCVAFKTSHARYPETASPDLYVVDFIPPASGSGSLVDAAAGIHTKLEAGGIRHFWKTGSAQSLQLCIPLSAGYRYDDLQPLQDAIESLVAERDLREIATADMHGEQKERKVLITTISNAEWESSYAPYSLILQNTGPVAVSVPLDWEEIRQGLYTETFTPDMTIARLSEKGDLFKDLWEKASAPEAILQALRRADS